MFKSKRYDVFKLFQTKEEPKESTVECIRVKYRDFDDNYLLNGTNENRNVQINYEPLSSNENYQRRIRETQIVIADRLSRSLIKNNEGITVTKISTSPNPQNSKLLSNQKIDATKQGKIKIEKSKKNSEEKKDKQLKERPQKKVNPSKGKEKGVGFVEPTEISKQQSAQKAKRKEKSKKKVEGANQNQNLKSSSTVKLEETKPKERRAKKKVKKSQNSLDEINDKTTKIKFDNKVEIIPDYPPQELIFVTPEVSKSKNQKEKAENTILTSTVSKPKEQTKVLKSKNQVKESITANLSLDVSKSINEVKESKPKNLKATEVPKSNNKSEKTQPNNTSDNDGKSKDKNEIKSLLGSSSNLVIQRHGVWEDKTNKTKLNAYSNVASNIFFDESEDDEEENTQKTVIFSKNNDADSIDSESSI